MGDAATLRGVAISVDVEPVPAVRGSPRDLSLMVRNLIDNAVRYTGNGGSVTVSVRKDGGNDVVRARRRHGHRDPAARAAARLRAVLQGRPSRSRDTGGTGLGLSIVRHVTENHGGEVSVTSELGQGTVFEVRLPTGRSLRRLGRWVSSSWCVTD